MAGLGTGIHVFVRSLKVYCWGRNGDECGSWLLNASFGSVVAAAAGAPWFTGSLTFPAFTLTSSRNYSNPYVLFDRSPFLKSVSNLLYFGQLPFHSAITWLGLTAHVIKLSRKALSNQEQHSLSFLPHQYIFNDLTNTWMPTPNPVMCDQWLRRVQSGEINMPTWRQNSP